MTEDEWLTCAEPGPLLDFVTRQGANDRKLRLWCVACLRACRKLAPDDAALWRAVKLAEALAERRVREAVCKLDVPVPKSRSPRCWQAHYMRLAALALFRTPAELAADPCYGPRLIAHVAPGFFTELARQADLARCILGNPFRPVASDPYSADPAAVAMSARLYFTRDFAQLPSMPISHPDMTAHCRSGGPHARGCWVLDTLLGVGWRYTPDTSSDAVVCSRAEELLT